MPCGATMSLIPFFIPCMAPYIAPPITGVRDRAPLPQSSTDS